MLRTVRICGLASAGFGFVSLLGWLLRIPFLASLGPERIPMAPSTALLFLLYGTATVLRARLPLDPVVRFFGVGVYSAGALVALLLGVFSFLGIRPAAELLGFPVVATVGETPVGHMSPVTAMCFLLASASFLGSLPSLSGRPWRTGAAWWAACLLLAATSVMLLAYLLGNPLFSTGFVLNAGPLIPPAATTCLAFATLGAALLALAGKQGGPPGRTTGPPQPFPYALVLIFLVLAAGIVAIGGLYFRADARRLRANMERELSTVADLKTGELAQWRSERLGDASFLLGNAPFSALARRVFDHPADAEARTQLRAWLARAKAHYAYDRASLFDAQGTERLVVPEGRAPASSPVASRVAEVLRSRQPGFEDFYRSEHDQRIYLDILVPILDEQNRALGVVALRIDPETYLYPFINRWPTPARTAETLLVRRDGNDALFLNELNYRTNTALDLRIPLASRDVTAVKAVLGQEGMVEGVDYRGTEVIAALRRVPNSPWFLVARMDVAEANAPIGERLWMMVLLVAVLLGAAGGGVTMVWRGERERDFQERYEADRERAWLHNVVASSVNEIYVFDPETLRFRFVNLGARRNIGYSEEEMAGLTPLDLKPEFTEASFRAMLEPLRAAERLAHSFETIHRRKDGSTYPVEVRLQLLDSGAGAVFLEVINDITERKQAEEAIRTAEARYRGLFEQSPDGVVLIDAETGKTIEANEVAARQLGYTRDEFASLTISDYEASGTPEETRRHIQKVLDEGSDNFETLHRTKKGEIRNVHVWAKALRLGERLTFHCIFEDVTDRRRAEQAIETSLREKEALLKEVHHRVKNNLQIITSLLRIEARRSVNALTGSVLIQMQHRIHSMALLHEALYRSGNFARVDLAFYLGQLADQLTRSLALRPEAVRLHLDLATVFLDIDKAVPCGLIVNELVSNSLKHGFPDGVAGKIWVRLHPAGDGTTFTLSVSDNGTGLPPDFESRRQDSLGIQLVSDLARQLQGSLKIGPGPEAVFEVTFSVTRTGEIARPREQKSQEIP